MSSTPAPDRPSPPPTPSDRLPRQTAFIVGNEACERFSFYGMSAILTLYMVKVLSFSKAEATEVSHYFKTAVYFMPLFGAWIADRWLGRFRTIMYISMFYCLGHAVLAFGEGTEWGLYAGLALIAIGAGGIKPCVSAFVGDQFGPGQRHLLPKVYGLFYWSINFGSFFAFGLIPTIRENYGYRWAFGIPGIAMALATLIFWLGRKHYVCVPPTGISERIPVFRIWWYAWMHRKERQPGQSWSEVAVRRFSPAEVDGARAVAGILMVFATVPVFWSLFDQTNTTWVLQGMNMTPWTCFDFRLDPVADRGWFPFLKVFLTEVAPGQFAFRLDAETIQSLNPLMVMMLIPVFTFGLYPLLERCGLQPRPLRRMAVGMLLAAGSFAVCGWVQARMDAGETCSILWQVIPYLVLTAGEVMLSATGLEFAFSQAPATMKSTIMSFWLLTSALGNFLVAVITGLNARWVKAEGATAFYFYAAFMLAVAAVFIVCAVRYRERDK